MARMNEKVVLPSNGLPYENHYPRELTIQNLTVDELSFLISSTSGNAIDDILASCVLEKDIDFKKLIIPDKHFLLIKARVLTWGKDYPIYPICPEHGEFKHIVNLNTLPVYELEADKFSPTWEVKLPMSGEIVTMALPTGEIYEEGEAYIKQRLARNPGLDEGRLRYKVDKCMSIVKVGKDEQSINELVDWIGQLHAVDGDFLNHELNKIEIGYDTLVIATCPKCKKEVKVRVGISADFFRTQFDD